MSDADQDRKSTIAISTQLEDDFIAPLTAIRGALELLRDHSDMDPEVRRRFIESGLRECARLERGVSRLAATVYPESSKPSVSPASSAFDLRLQFLQELNVIDLDFSDYVFENSEMVYAFYDVIERQVAATGRKWHFVVNFRDCRIWPEAWVAFAHRGKKLAVNYALETVRYAVPKETEDGIVETSAAADLDPNLYVSREAALAHIAAVRSGEAPPRR